MSRALCEVSNSQILDRLKSQGWTSCTDIRDTYGQDRKAALRWLIRLEVIGVVKEQGVTEMVRNTRGPTKIYVLVDPDIDMEALSIASRRKPSEIQPRPVTSNPVITSVLDAWARVKSDFGGVNNRLP